MFKTKILQISKNLKSEAYRPSIKEIIEKVRQKEARKYEINTDLFPKNVEFKLRKST